MVTTYNKTNKTNNSQSEKCLFQEVGSFAFYDFFWGRGLLYVLVFIKRLPSVIARGFLENPRLPFIVMVETSQLVQDVVYQPDVIYKCFGTYKMFVLHLD